MNSTSPLVPQAGSSTAPVPASAGSWNPPKKLTGVEVLPDRYTTLEKLANKTIGKPADPGRMGIYLCLLDDRPHLHPSLSALHRHRHTAHGIPLPLDPTKDLPVSSSAFRAPASTPLSPDTATAGILASQDGGTGEEAIIKGAESSSSPQIPRIEVGLGEDGTGNDEWVMWKFSPEEEERRKAYLPLD